MKSVLSALLLVILSVGFARGADQPAMAISKPAITEQIAGVIEAQLAAFRAGEIDRAHGFASEALRRQTPAPAFARLVQQSYPEIWRSTRAEVGLVRDNGARATVVVRVFAQETEAAYDYVLFKEAAGWRIGGVLRHEASAANRL